MPWQLVWRSFRAVGLGECDDKHEEPTWFYARHTYDEDIVMYRTHRYGKYCLLRSTTRRNRI